MEKRLLKAAPAKRYDQTSLRILYLISLGPDDSGRSGPRANRALIERSANDGTTYARRRRAE